MLIKDNLVNVHLDGDNLTFDVICCRCGKVYTRINYNSRYGYICPDCVKKRDKEHQQKLKQEKKEEAERALRKFRTSVKKCKKDTCEHFCIIPRLSKDDNAQKEACNRCPFLQIESMIE